MKKNHMIISIQKKAFDRMQHTFTIKFFSKLRIERNFLDLIMNIYTKATDSIIFNGDEPKAFPLRSRSCPGIFLLPLLSKSYLKS